MIDDYYSAGPLWFGRYSYYPYLPDKSNEEKADELIRRGSLIDTKSFDIFLDSANTEALTRRVTALRGTLFNITQDIGRLEERLEKRGVWDRGLYRWLRIE